MKRISILPLVFCTCFALTAWAQSAPRASLLVAPRAQGAKVNVTNPSDAAANLYAVAQAFVHTSYPAVNSDGSDLWPCIGRYTSTTPANPDCPTIGDPSVPFPHGGVVLGGPHYIWSLSDCDATSTSTLPCGQVEWFYEDNTEDTTDDLLFSWTAQQGTNYIYDSGIQDYGSGLISNYPATIIFYNDQNFGTMGETGKNNGNCYGDYNYPITTSPPTYPFVIAANKTCVAPDTGPVTIIATTELATPAYKTEKGVTTVKYTVKYKIEQKWTIYLQ